MQLKKILSRTILLLFMCYGSWIQAQPFANEIRDFKKRDSSSFPPKGAILFVGSSSFRLWTELDRDFPGHTIINRGFGGSSFPDVIRYADDIIYPYQPKQIVIYCGDNDFAASDTVSSRTVLDRFRDLFDSIRKKLPEANIVFVSMKPSPSRLNQMPKEEETNGWIQQFLSSQKNTAFVDVYHSMLKADGKPNGEIFRSDSLHMNAKGYAIWQQLINPYLLSTNSSDNL